MPAKIDNPWQKSGSCFLREQSPFTARVVKDGYRNWHVEWSMLDYGDLQTYMTDIPTAAIAKTHADKLLARLTAAIQVKESACT